jgi:hypothetical protein
MPNISKAQSEALSEIGDFGENKNLYGPVKLSITAKVLAQYGAEFKLKVAENLNNRRNIGQGTLADTITPKIIEEATETVLQVYVNDYYDFVNLGVKGVKSSKNAPRSPYQFKNYGVPETMRQSLKTYIQSGRAKVSNVRRDKAYGIGLESKGKSLIDTQVDTLGYLIKRFGIKGSMYFTDAFNEVFKDFSVVMAKAVGTDIVFTLKNIKLNGNNTR